MGLRKHTVGRLRDACRGGARLRVFRRQIQGLTGAVFGRLIHIVRYGTWRRLGKVVCVSASGYAALPAQSKQIVELQIGFPSLRRQKRLANFDH